MPRRGRELERVVAGIESALWGVATIRSPEYVVGRLSGTQREIDVGVRAIIGSSPVFIMIECRDRVTTGDLNWLEAVSSKREDVGADKGVVVSASGYTEGARNWAAAKGIELRTTEELDPSTVIAWLGIADITIVRPCVDLSLEVEVDGDPAWESTHEWRDWTPVQELTIATREGSRSVSVAEAWERSARREFWDSVPMDGTHQPVHLVTMLRDVPLTAETPFVPATVRSLRFSGDVWVETERLTVDRASTYGGPKGEIARNVWFTSVENDERLTVVMHVVRRSAGHDRQIGMI